MQDTHYEDQYDDEDWEDELYNSIDDEEAARFEASDIDEEDLGLNDEEDDFWDDVEDDEIVIPNWDGTTDEDEDYDFDDIYGDDE